MDENIGIIWSCTIFCFVCHQSYQFLMKIVFQSSKNCCILQRYKFLVVNFWAWQKCPSLFSFNVWALCPTGSYLNGLRVSRALPGYLNDIDEAQCCHPQNHPNSYEQCYDEDVSRSFDDKGWSECKKPGYYMTGFYKSSCNQIYCIEKFRCCKMKKRNFYFVYFNHESAVLKITTLTENLHSNGSFPILLPVRQPALASIYNQYF